MTKYKVIYSIDSLDTEPDTELFDNEQEAIDWLNEEITRRVDYHVQHSPYKITEKQYKDLEEIEMSLARIEEVR